MRTLWCSAEKCVHLVASAFFAQLCQRRQGGFALGGFLAFALAARQFRSAVMHGALENPVVVRAGGGNDLILRRLGRDGLQQFLQFAFGVFENGNHREPAKGRLELRGE